jgi:hypothetical protein
MNAIKKFRFVWAVSRRLWRELGERPVNAQPGNEVTFTMTVRYK